MPVFARYDLDDKGTVAADSAVSDGAQNGSYVNGAASIGGRATFNGVNDRVVIASNDFQLDQGTLEIQFSQASATNCTQSILSRDSKGQTEGGFRAEVLSNGAILITRESDASSTTFKTAACFQSPCDEAKLSCSRDMDTGGKVLIKNLTTGETFSDDTPPGLTMDMRGDDDDDDDDEGGNRPWIVGAVQSRSDPDRLNIIDSHFQASVEHFQISNSVDNCPERDGFVDGTAGDDLIDLAYTGEPDGDRIDNNDALLPGAAPNDDFVRAGAGDDTVFGGIGNDTIIGGEGVDSLAGGADRNPFLVSAPGDGIGDVVDGNEDGDDFDTLDLRRSGPLRVTFADDNPENGIVTFFDEDGNETGTLTFRNIENVMPCFTPGTLVATPKGEVPVESLQPGDKIITRDNGIQEIRWFGAKHMDWAALCANPHLKPVRIRQGSLGNGLPERDMLVSPNHRMLVANDRTALYFEEHEVLVAAKHLVGAAGIHAVDSAGATYVHFMFDRHEVVLANGAWTESFQPGDYSLKGIGNAQRSEIYELFPDLRSEEGVGAYGTARKTLKKHEASLLLQR